MFIMIPRDYIYKSLDITNSLVEICEYLNLDFDLCSQILPREKEDVDNLLDRLEILIRPRTDINITYDGDELVVLELNDEAVTEYLDIIKLIIVESGKLANNNKFIVGSLLGGMGLTVLDIIPKIRKLSNLLGPSGSPISDKVIDALNQYDFKWCNSTKDNGQPI